MTRVFVYGSLRAGESNHAHMVGARFICEVRTACGFALTQLGRWPAMVRGGSDAVEGELFEVDDAHLARLDEFEGVPDLYLRETVELEDGSYADAWLRATSVRFSGDRSE